MEKLIQQLLALITHKVTGCKHANYIINICDNIPSQYPSKNNNNNNNNKNYPIKNYNVNSNHQYPRLQYQTCLPMVQ